MHNESRELLSYAEVEAQFGIPIATLYSAVSRRKIPHVRLGPRWVRFRRSELEAWIDDHSVTPCASVSAGAAR